MEQDAVQSHRSRENLTHDLERGFSTRCVAILINHLWQSKSLAQSTFSKSISDSFSSPSSAFLCGWIFPGCKCSVMDPLATAQWLLGRAPSPPWPWLVIISGQQKMGEWVDIADLAECHQVAFVIHLTEGFPGGGREPGQGHVSKSQQTELSSLVQTWLMVAAAIQ